MASGGDSLVYWLLDDLNVWQLLFKYLCDLFELVLVARDEEQFALRKVNNNNNNNNNKTTTTSHTHTLTDTCAHYHIGILYTHTP